MNAIVPVQPNYPMGDLERMANAVAKSGLFGITKPDQALALMLVAQAEGMHPASAARDYHIISGRPAKKAEAMLRDFIANGGKVEWHELNDAKADATFSHPYGGTVRIDWTAERAKQAGIANPMWKKYPRQMLRSRVVSEGVRSVCPGATSGMYVPEEVQDIVHDEGAREVLVTSQEPTQQQTRKRKSSAQATRDNDHERIFAEIAKLDDAGIVDWLTHFDENTADLPLSWLDPLRDKIEMRREEIASERVAAAGNAEMDDEYAARFRDGGAGSVSGDNGHLAAAE